MTEWSIYTEGRQHTVDGALRIAHQIYSAQLDNARDVLIYLPPSYHEGSRRYPVVYMHDGQNLFDAHTSFSGEWHVDETMQQLAQDGIEAIVVGIPSIGHDRIHEYNPYPTPRFKQARGDAYVRFLIETLKPLIDSDFRSLPDPQHTGILGSSMGGLISLYAWLAYPWTFGLAGSMSPSLWVARQEVFDHVRHSPFNEGRLYIDIGTRELPRRFSRFGSSMTESVSLLKDRLNERGYSGTRRLKYVLDRGGEHNEAAWSRRLPDALRFLLTP
jgi:predicted alpha/beta superfamily hydrolase